MKKNIIPLVLMASLASACSGENERKPRPVIEKMEPQKTYLEKLEEKVHNLINVERRNYGLSELMWNNQIAQAARYHSDDMANRDYFSHLSPENHDFSWRYSEVGFNCAIYQGDKIYHGAENIQLAISSDKDYFADTNDAIENLARDTVQGWMNSQGHKENILTPFFYREGIGISITSDGEIYFTQDFC
jgi:uncharacterized protein YkwD